MIDDCCLILLNITSKATEAIENKNSSAGEENKEPKSEEQIELEKVLKDFHGAVGKLLPKKIFETLQI
jgi:hypothetical protein